jgi:predicted flap endonuclease-1-like 5' DNA nuclease
MDITKESEAYLAKREEQQRTAETNKRAAAKKLAEDRKRAAEEAERKEEAYIRSLPLLIGPGDEVAVATSMDCAKDLRDIVAFGKRMEQALNSAGRCSNSSRWDAPLRSRAEHGY